MSAHTATFHSTENGSLLCTDVLVVSLGLDTVAGDPDSRPGHGFALGIEDYSKMGALFRSTGLQTLVLQEGGYHLDQVPRAVRAFITAVGGYQLNL